MGIVLTLNIVSTNVQLACAMTAGLRSLVKSCDCLLALVMSASAGDGPAVMSLSGPAGDVGDERCAFWSADELRLLGTFSASLGLRLALLWCLSRSLSLSRRWWRPSPLRFLDLQPTIALCRQVKQWFPLTKFLKYFEKLKSRMDADQLRMSDDMRSEVQHRHVLEQQIIYELFKQIQSVFARSPISLPRTPFSRSLTSPICNPGPHPKRTLWTTKGGPERATKRRLGDREKIVQRIALKLEFRDDDSLK